MRKIEALIQENRTNHYKLLTIIGNNESKVQRIISYLAKKGWVSFDVENVLFQLIEDIPEDKIRLRIGLIIKKWLKEIGNKTIFFNTNILYSPEMNKIGPFSAFKYAMRGEKEGILIIDTRLRGNMAIFSTPDRKDYHEQELKDVLFIKLDDVDFSN